MSEKICNRCGQVLNKFDKLCPDCLAVQTINRNVQGNVSTTCDTPRSRGVNKDILFDDVFDTDFDRTSPRQKHQKSTVRSYSSMRKAKTTESQFGFSFLGFILGCMVPFMLVFVLSLMFSAKTVRHSGWTAVRKSMLRTALIVQIIIPLVAGLIFILANGYI